MSQTLAQGGQRMMTCSLTQHVCLNIQAKNIHLAKNIFAKGGYFTYNKTKQVTLAVFKVLAITSSISFTTATWCPENMLQV